MGDRKQSQFLSHLKSLAPDVPEDFLRSIWASRLPPHIQTILAGQAEGNLDAALQLADRIAEVAPLPTTASIAQAPDAAGLLQTISVPGSDVVLHCDTSAARPRPYVPATLWR